MYCIIHVSGLTKMIITQQGGCRVAELNDPAAIFYWQSLSGKLQE